MRHFKKASIVLLVLAALAAGFYAFYMGPRRVIPILMYHSISGDKSSTLNVSPENFERQMAFLKDQGYSVISLEEAVESIKKGRRFIPGTVVLTFDDGYRDNFLNAFPVVSRYGMPATIFLITDYVGRNPDYMTWDHVRLMIKNGIDFGGHTRTNVYLPSVNDPEKLEWEIAGCREDIRVNTGGEADHFCYPTGGFNAKVKEAVRSAGYKAACTTNRGKDRLNRDVYELKRVKVTNSDTTKPLHFRAKLSGFYNVFRSTRAGD